MPVANYKYTYDFPNSDYSIELWFGEADAFSAPTEIELDEETIIDLTLNGESDNPFGLPTASQATLKLKLDKFNTFQKIYFLQGKIEDTTLTLFNVASGTYAGNYQLNDFPCLNTIKVINNGNVEFIGVQEVQETIDTDENSIFELKFTCIIAKALQLFPFQTSRVNANGDKFGFVSSYILNQGTGSGYDKYYINNYLVDNYYLTSFTNAVVVRDEKDRDAGYYSTTFKNLFEIVGSLTNVIINLWLRDTDTFTINNPLAYMKLYKLDGASTMLKGTLLTENEIQFIFYRTDGIDVFGETSNLPYDSWWEFLREFTSNYYIRSKINYSTLTISHLPIKDLTDEVTINGEVGVSGNYSLYEWIWNQSIMSLKNSTKYTYPKGSPYENEQIDVSYKNNGNGNLRRLEFNLDFHNVPITASNHRHRKVWNATDNNMGAIGYIESLEINGISTHNNFVRCSDYVEVKRDDTNYYSPTEQTNTVTLPNAQQDNVGGVVAANYLTWRNNRLSTTTIPTVINYVIMNYLRNTSATFEFETDQDVSLNNLNGTLTFNDYSFLPDSLQLLDGFGWISKIEKSVIGSTITIGTTITT
jgi:hypothetical protein